MSVAIGIVGLWGLFAATHMGMSSQSLRPRLVAALGERGFLGVYSLLALAIFTALCWLYFPNRHVGAQLWSPIVTGSAGLWIVYVLQAVAWTLVVAGNLSPSPASIAPDPKRGKEPRGVHLLTRHPLFTGVALFGALHLLFMGFASDVAFWSGFPLFTLAGCAHQDRRKRATLPDYAAWCAAAPFLPFAGNATLRGLRELPPSAIAIGVALTGLLRWLHGPLFR